MKEMLTLALSILLALSPLPAALAEDTGAAQPPARFVTDEKQLATLASLTAVNAENTFYTLEYTADYRLDDMLAANVTDLAALTEWVSKNLLN